MLLLHIAGPCTEGNVGKFPKCSLKDILGDDEQLYELLDQNPYFVTLIIETYFPKENIGKLKGNKVLSEPKKENNIGQETEQQQKVTKKLEGKEIYVASSTWPWNKNIRDDELNLPISCTCLQSKEIYEMINIQIDFDPCSQPIPWCFVRNEANCYDQTEYKGVDVKCPDCVGDEEGKDSEKYLLNSQVISWSTAACSKQILPEILKKPYFF